MKKENTNGILSLFDSSFTLYDLKMRAAKIKSGYLLKDSIHSLLNFVDTANLRLSNS